MNFHSTKIPGTFLIEPERLSDERGFFCRTWCEREFSTMGVASQFVQCNVSFNRRKGTLRGMHYQAWPHEEQKLVRCTQGAVYDVVVDLRPDSPTFLQWQAFELTAENRHALYIPGGVAHGFQTLADECELHYQMSEFYVPDAARGVRWNDPAFAIDWPIANPFMSDKDWSYADFGDIERAA